MPQGFGRLRFRGYSALFQSLVVSGAASLLAPLLIAIAPALCPACHNELCPGPMAFLAPLFHTQLLFTHPWCVLNLILLFFTLTKTPTMGSSKAAKAVTTIEVLRLFVF